MQESWQWSIITDLSTISADEQKSLLQGSANHTPFLSLPFLQLLASSASVDNDTGWQTHHIAIYTDSHNPNTNNPNTNNNNDLTSSALIALVPCYLKTHSYGEYVFDHSWANAYHQHSLPYYPKLVCAVPFTPVSGDRALLVNSAVEQGITEIDIFAYIAKHKKAILDASDTSSLHLLFPNKELSDSLSDSSSDSPSDSSSNAGMHQRLSVQFVWRNNNYESFDGFLDELTSRKRRSIRKERAPFLNGEVAVKRLSGKALSQEIVDAFYLCYQQTYLKRSGHTGYLSATFFADLLANMGQQVCIIAAFKNDIMIAGSLFFYNKHGLYGRYWGALEEVSGLHFECCYYQGIEFAIEKKIDMFNPGTQGEHKILRGFRPTFCFSNHSMSEPAFDAAVADFVTREQDGIKRYHAQASEVLPYKQSDV